jgi:hypothetical protein
MCSIRGSGSQSGSSHEPSIATQLHAVLDRLLGADLSGLSAHEHSALVARLLRAEHCLHAGTLDAVAALDTADVAATSRHRTTKRMPPGSPR